MLRPGRLARLAEVCEPIEGASETIGWQRNNTRARLSCARAWRRRWYGVPNCLAPTPAAAFIVVMIVGSCTSPAGSGIPGELSLKLRYRRKGKGKGKRKRSNNK